MISSARQAGSRPGATLGKACGDDGNEVSSSQFSPWLGLLAPCKDTSLLAVVPLVRRILPFLNISLTLTVLTKLVVVPVVRVRNNGPRLHGVNKWAVV